MKRFAIPAFLVAGVIAVASVVAYRSAAPSPAKEAIQVISTRNVLADMRLAVSNPIQQDRMTIIPITTNRPATQQTPDVATLAEAMEKGWIKIEEGGEFEFNGVQISNTGPKPILLIAGDLVVGGHQDRVVAHDTLIQPGETKDVEVYCVEAGRSTGDTDEFKPADTPVPYRVRREAMFARSQDRVWGAVSSFNGLASAAPATQTVQGGLNTERVQNYVKDHSAELAAKLAEVPNAIGYVVIIDGKPDMVEIFGSNALLKRLAPHMLKGLAADQALRPEAVKTPVTADVEAYIVSTLRGARKAQSEVDGARSFRVVSEDRTQGYESYSGTKAGGTGVLLHGSFRK